jgi:hypothetical protein
MGVFPSLFLLNTPVQDFEIFLALFENSYIFPFSTTKVLLAFPSKIELPVGVLFVTLLSPLSLNF